MHPCPRQATRAHRVPEPLAGAVTELLFSAVQAAARRVGAAAPDAEATRDEVVRGLRWIVESTLRTG